MAGIGSNIQASDYNTIRTKVIEVLGSGIGPLGYGQTLIQSQQVVSSNVVTAEHWQRLRLDLANVRIHQTGIELSKLGLSEVVSGDVIKYRNNEPNFEYLNVIEAARLDPFRVAQSRTVLSSKVSETYSQEWSTIASAELTVSFNNADEARYFFNSGGKILFSSTRSGGSITQQNSVWTSLLSSVGNFAFGGNTPNFVNFYRLTDEPQVVLEVGPGAVYANNFYIIRARANVEDNTNGGATEIIFDIEWVDGYEDPGPPPPGDLVNGVLSLSISEVKASGPLVSAQAGQVFTVEGPSDYSLSPISAS